MATNQNTNATFRTHYANHVDERCTVLEVISEASVKVQFEDGAVEIVSRQNVIED